MIFITGFNGLIGQRLVGYLAEKHEICPLDLRNKYSFDCAESSQSGEANVLVHLAWESLPSMGSSKNRDFADGDIARSRQLLRQFATSSLKGKSIIFLSSSGSIYGSSDDPVVKTESSGLDPKSDYAYAKICIEHEISILNIPSISLRCANAWGARVCQGRRNGLIDIAIHNTFMKQVTSLYVNPRSVISLIHVEDICKAIDLSIEFLRLSNTRLVADNRYVVNLSSESKSITEITSLLSTTIGTVFDHQSDQKSKPTYNRVASENIKILLSWEAKRLLSKESITDCYRCYL